MCFNVAGEYLQLSIDPFLYISVAALKCGKGDII